MMIATCRTLWAGLTAGALLLCPAVALSADEPSLAGTWNVKVLMDSGQELQATLKVTSGDEGYEAVYHMADFGESTDAQEIKLEDGKVKFSIDVDVQGTPLLADFDGDLKGDKIEGTVDYDLAGQTGALGFTAERVPAAMIVGTWNLEVDAVNLGGGVYRPEMIISEGEEGLTGKFVADDGQEAELDSVTILGNDLVVNMTLDFQGTPVEVKVAGEVDGASFTGVADLDFGGQAVELPVTGELAPVLIAGRWELYIDAGVVGGPVLEPIVHVWETEDGVQGEMILMERDPAALENISLEGNNLAFSVTSDFEGTPLTTNYTAQVTGDSLEGVVEFDLAGQAGELDITGTRKAFVVELPGTWELSVDATSVSGETYQPMVKISQDGTEMKGTLTMDDGQEVDLTDISVTDNVLSFAATLDFQGEELKTTYSLIVLGDRLLGDVEYSFDYNKGELPVTGERGKE